MTHELIQQSGIENEIVEYPVSCRVIVTKPITSDEMQNMLIDISHETDFNNLQLTKSIWIISGPDSHDPWKMMAVGGKVCDTDRKMADQHNVKTKDKQNQSAAGNFPDMVIQISTTREAQDEIDLYGLKYSDVQILNPDNPIIDHDSKRTSYWTAVLAQHDFIPHSFFPSDHIHDITQLSPLQVKQMFSINKFKTEEGTFSLISSLSTPDKSKPEASQISSSENAKTLILNQIEQEEKVARLKLAEELILRADNNSVFGQANSGTMRILKMLINTTNQSDRFDSEYQKFLRKFYQYIPTTSEIKLGKKEQKLAIFKQQIIKAWHRVLFKKLADHAASIPVQGELLAARLPTHDFDDEELKYLIEHGPEYAANMSDFVNLAMTPNFPDDNNQDGKLDGLDLDEQDLSALSQKPVTTNELYRRLELLRYLKIHESDKDFSADQLLLLKLWQSHIYEAFEESFGISKDNFPEISYYYNLYNDDILKNIAPKTAKSRSVLPLLQRSPDSEVSQLEELILMTYGYSQYQEAPRGQAIYPRAIFDARLKLFELPLIKRAKDYFFPAIHRSTYFWRRIINDLSSKEKLQNQQNTPLVMIDTSQGNISNSILHNEIEELHPEPPDYILYWNEKSKIPDIAPSGKTDQQGIAVHHHRTDLKFQNIPIYFFERTRDKNLLKLIRKMWERGIYPEHILDVYGTAFTIDTLTPDVKQKLEKEYKKYQMNSLSNLKKPEPYQDWVKKWSINAIRKMFVPAISQTAQDLNYSFIEDKLKDKLVTKEATAGSAASMGGYSELKYYAQLDLTTDLAGGQEEESEESEKIEVTIFPCAEEYLTKVFGSKNSFSDEEYSVLRWEMVNPGSGLYPLWQLNNPPPIYGEAYKEVTGYRIRVKTEELKRRNIFYDLLRRSFEPVRGILFKSKK